MEILRKVKCSDRLPEKEDKYWVIKMVGKHKGLEHFIPNYYSELWIEQNEYWYEPIEIELDSEKILLIEDRIKWNKEPEPTDTNYMINILFWKYHKALEAEKLKNIQFQIEVNNLKGHILEYQHKQFEINAEIEDLKTDADERYNKALEIFNKDTNNITFQFEQYLLSPEEFKKYLKIAAYGTDK
jgi:hypothetical protein